MTTRLVSLPIQNEQALRPVASGRRPAATAVAYYVGSQERLTGAPVDLFNLLVPLPSIDRSIIHPVESTVSRMTLEANGVRCAPTYLTIGQRVMQSAS